MTKPKNEFDTFIDALTDELIATPDEHLLEGHDPAAVQANGLRLLQSAKAAAGRSRMAAARAGYANLKSRPHTDAPVVSAAEARRFIAQASNDVRFTLAARNLGDLSDDEVIKLYAKLRSLQPGDDGTK